MPDLSTYPELQHPEGCGVCPTSCPVDTVVSFCRRKLWGQSMNLIIHIHLVLRLRMSGYLPPLFYTPILMWWPGLKNSPTVTHACRKRRLKWVPSVWGYSWATLSPRVINTETWSSRLGVGHWTNNPAP
jgi:hypothetical protein